MQQMSFLLVLLIGIGYTGVNCSTSALNTVRICQGDSTTILCPQHQLIKIYTAQYGRFVPGRESCPHKSVKYLPSYTCISDVTPLLETQCDDRVECVIHATNKNLGDPCRGIFKHLDIKFYCDAAQATTSSPPLTSPPVHKVPSNTLSREIMKCTKLYTSVLDSAPHKECDAMQTYKDCLLRVEMIDPSSVEDIERVMPTLDGNLESCYTAAKTPLVKLCKHPKLKGDCVNITAATPDLGDFGFDNSVKSVKVYAGNWALYSDPGFNGLEDRVKPGFTSYWLGIYAPVKGEPISLYSNDLSSLKPVDDVDSGYYFDYTEPTTEPTSDFKSDAQSTPDFRVSYPYTEEPTVVTHHLEPETHPGYSQWVNLDDVPSSKQPDMCRSTYCLLGIRVIFNQIRSITLPTRQTVEDAILNRLLDVYQIYPEQLVLAEIVTRSSEIILEIVDMRDAPKRVIDIATEIEKDIKGKEFTFTIAETMLVPNSERFGVMLKTISEEYLPKRIDLVTEPEEKEVTTEPGSSTPPNVVETIEPEEWKSDNAIDCFEPTVPPTSKAGIMGMPSKYFYPLLATSLLLLILACVVISTVMYRCVLHNRDYSLIKKVPSSLSNIYLDVDEVLPLPKKVEGFENPSYLLEEVDHM